MIRVLRMEDGIEIGGVCSGEMTGDGIGWDGI